MKFSYWLFITVLVFYMLLACSCKTRHLSQVTTHTTRDSTHTTAHDSTGSKVTHTIDTSKTVTRIVTVNRDSSVTTTDLTPDSGSSATIARDGSISGKFKHIKQTTVRHGNNTREETRKQNLGKDSAVTQASQVYKLDSGRVRTQRDSTNKQVKSDSTIAKNFPWWYMVLVVGILGVAFFLLKRFKII